MNTTKIEWTDRVWNPVTGCTKVSQGCKHCYAERDWDRLSNNPKTVYLGRKFTDVMCHPERLPEPLRWKKPCLVFVNSMSDLFHYDVPYLFLDRVFAVMALANQHAFQVLTKRPQQMLKYLSSRATSIDYLEAAARSLGHTFIFEGHSLLPWPIPNIWLGVSVEDQAAADERIPLLLETPAAVRFISAEPLLGSVNISRYLKPLQQSHSGGGWTTDFTVLDWVIAGGESGPKARPMHPQWVRDIRDQCQDANIPFLFKQWGEFAPHTQLDDAAKALANKLPISKIHLFDDGIMVFRVNKKLAGRTLDGRIWDEYPQATQ